jgi:small conductance mechanosensitive channel
MALSPDLMAEESVTHLFLTRMLMTVVAVLALLLAPAQLEAQADRGVRLDGDLIFRVGASGQTTADARAQQIESRLLAVLERPTGGLDPIVRRDDANRASSVIVVGGTTIVTVTPDDAAANGTTVERLAATWADQLRDVLPQARDRRTSAWQRFGAQVRGSVRTALARLLETIAVTLPGMLAALVVLLMVWGVATGVRRLVRAGVPSLIRDATIQSLVRQMSYYAVWIVGILVALDAFGFNPQTFVTGLGLTSVALGFALKDIVSNLVSGVLLQALRPFELGDQIVVGATEGSVEAINLRATHIRTYDGRLVLVPNGEVFTSRVTNNTSAPLRRGSVEIYLDYGQDVQHAMAVAQQIAQGTPGVAPTPATYARLRNLDTAGMMLEVRFWTDSQRSDFMATSCAVRLAVMLALKKAGIALPNTGPREVLIKPAEAGPTVLS